MTLIYFRELLTDLQVVRVNFYCSNSIKQYNLEGGKVGEGWKGKDEGFGKWVETTDLPSPH